MRVSLSNKSSLSPPPIGVIVMFGSVWSCYPSYLWNIMCGYVHVYCSLYCLNKEVSTAQDLVLSASLDMAQLAVIFYKEN